MVYIKKRPVVNIVPNFKLHLLSDGLNIERRSSELRRSSKGGMGGREPVVEKDEPLLSPNVIDGPCELGIRWRRYMSRPVRDLLYSDSRT